MKLKLDPTSPGGLSIITFALAVVVAGIASQLEDGVLALLCGVVVAVLILKGVIYLGNL